MIQTLMTIAAALLLSANTGAAADLPSALVDPYLQIQVALASDQFAPIAVHAQAVETAAAALGADGAALTASAKKLVAAKDIAAARTAYGDVSSALEAYAVKTKSGFGKDVRLAYCPMVNKPWLQKDKEIRNPYYGASMLTCGSFKD
ncbi:MAG TPA: hypothetical protein VNJ02_14740 [Vicinamibacterales bacterium]|nr:hypothetical protein [Vicinamibacterales bacterium]